jgi:hypothetical protein
MGSVEFLVFTFPGANPGPGAVRALAGLRLSGAVRVIDTLLVAKAADGSITTGELAEPRRWGMRAANSPRWYGFRRK